MKRQELEAIVQSEGLELFGLVALEPELRYHSFKAWLTEGKHGQLSFLERYQSCRQDPRTVLEGGRSALIIGFNYYLGDRYKDAEKRVGQYARFRDYHRFLRKKLDHIAEKLSPAFPGHAWRGVTDSAPLLERALAEKCAEGFIGKNTCFIHPVKGSWFLLGELLTSAEFHYDSPEFVDPKLRSSAGGCGSCRRCEVYCPTGALEDYTLDARKCLSYYSIEHRGQIPLEYWPWFRWYWFGCDICQLVCPYNKRAKVQSSQPKLSRMPPLEEVVMMNQEYYVEVFGGTPMTRAKRLGLRRNALIAMVVTNHELLPEIFKNILKEGEQLLVETVKQAQLYSQ